MMEFYDVVAQVVQLLQQQGRVTYRGLKRQFDLDDDFLDDLKEEIIDAQRVAVEEDGRILVWTGETEAPTVTTSPPDQAETQPTAQEEPPTQVASLPPEPHIPDAERRQLTILFTDLVDSTKLSGQLDAEDYRELVRGYQAACAEVIERFDCHLAQTLGDGLLIYSGYPVAHENDAERAVRVGLGILEAMTMLNERLDKDKGIHLGVRVGIHTGPVVVGDVGAGERQEQLALGEVPNVAARIQGLAEPNTVIISAATYQLVEGYFDCETLGERELRGVTEPLDIYRVLGESGIQSRLDVASTRGLTPLVGREQEVGLLLDRWTQVKDGSGQVALLSGEAGIGKSRLVQVLKDHVAEEAHTRLECRSSPYYQNTALYPITDLLQRILQWHQDDTPAERLEKLEQELGQYRLPLEETVPLFGTLLSMLVPEERYPSLTLTPQRQRQMTLETILAIILELSERQPVLFILEDLHWTDPTTLEFLDLLIDQTPTATICVLLTSRPEFQPTWSHRSYLTEMTINRLSQDQAEQIATQVAHGKTLPTEIVEQLVAKTDGVPLYVEEMTKAVLEAGVLKETNEHYELTASLTSLSIPATLQDSLMARLDRLMTAKVVAQLGAVMGRQFSYELLQAVSQLDEAMLQHELNRLVEAELLYQRGLPPQATYTFKHALVQNIAYESLLRSTRQGYHRRIAQVLEEQFPEMAEMQPELLAHHYTEAGVIDQAVGYWHKAGQKAIQRSANVEAIAHLNQGLELLERLPDTLSHRQSELDIQVALGAALMVTKGFAAPEVEHVYTRVRTLSQQVEETPQLLHVLGGLRRFYSNRGAMQTARELAEQTLNLAQRTQDPIALLDAHYSLGVILLNVGKLPESHTHFTQGMALSENLENRAAVFLFGRTGVDLGRSCGIRAAQTLWLLGYPDQGHTYLQVALYPKQERPHLYTQAYVLSFGVFVLQGYRDVSTVRQQAQALVKLSREQGFTLYEAIGTLQQGWVFTMLGNPDQGVQYIRQGMAALQTTGQVSSRPYYLALLAQAYGGTGQVKEGLNVLAEALTLVDKTSECVYEAELHRLRGELLLQQSADNATEAESCFHQAISVAQNQSAKSWELRAATSLAKLWQSQDKRKDAYDLLAPVYGWFTEGFDTADLIDAKALLDELSEVR